MADGLKVRFWGVRGSISCSGAEYTRYGGNTSCLEVTAGGRRLIFDARTGALDRTEAYVDKPLLHRIHSGEAFGATARKSLSAPHSSAS